MLYLISLGLWDEKDMSIKALETAKKCDKLYVEFYTNKTGTSAEKLGKLIGKKVVELPRSGMEDDSGKLLEEANSKDVGVFVPGDALVATTHLSLLTEAKEKGIKYKVIHGSSILTAVASTGLQLYKFGKVTTLCYPQEGYEPKTCFETIRGNKKIGAHTLVLLDVKPPKYMSVKEGLEILEKAEIISGQDRVVVACQLGGDETVSYGKVHNLKKVKQSKTPAVIIIPGDLHFTEKEFLEGL